MFFVLTSLAIYYFKVYMPFDKTITASLSSLVLMLLLKYLENEDSYISGMQKKKRFSFLLLVLLSLYTFIAIYLPTVVFGVVLVNITRVLCDHYKVKRLNRYFRGYEVF
jgi:hypothetical protein